MIVLKYWVLVGLKIMIGTKGVRNILLRRGEQWAWNWNKGCLIGLWMIVMSYAWIFNTFGMHWASCGEEFIILKDDIFSGKLCRGTEAFFMSQGKSFSWKVDKNADSNLEAMNRKGIVKLLNSMVKKMLFNCDW